MKTIYLKSISITTMLIAYLFSLQQVSGQCLVKSSCEKSNFNATPIAANNYIWFSSNVKVDKITTTAAVTINFTGQTIVCDNFSIIVPNAKVIIDKKGGATKATTTYDASKKLWTTKVPYSLRNNIFLSGVAFKVPLAGLPGKIKPITWCGNFTSSVSGVRVKWQWAAAVYTSFDAVNYNNDKIKPCNDPNLSAYKNGDNAGTPEAKKAYVIRGARGGGGNNYTGGFHGDASVIPGGCCFNFSIYSTAGSYFCSNTGGTLYADSTVTSFYWLSDGSTGSTLAVPPGQGGTFTVIGTNSEGCSDTASINLQVDPEITVNAGPDLTVTEGSNITLHATVGGGYAFDPMCLTWTGPNGFLANVTGTIGGAPGDVTIFNATALQAGTYIVTAYDCFGSACTAYDTVNLSVVAPRLSGNILHSLSDLTVYPNPAHDRLNIQFNSSDASTSQLKMMDMTGRMMVNEMKQAQPGINNLNIDVSNFSKGIYILSVSSGNDEKFMRVVIE